MASIASLMQRPPAPVPLLTQNDQTGQTNALEIQRQQIALEQERVQQAKEEAIARARAIKDAQAYTDAVRAGQEEFDRSRRPVAPMAMPPVAAAAAAPPAASGNSIPAAVASPPVAGETPANNAAAGGAVPQSQNSLAGATMPMDPANPRPDEMTDRVPEPAGNSVASALSGPPVAPIASRAPAAPTRAVAPKPMSPQARDEFVVRRLIQNGASGATVDAFRKSQLALHEGAAKLDSETIKNRIAIGLQAGEIFAGAMKAPPELWPQSKARLEQLEPGIQLPDTKPSDEQFNLLIAHNGYTLNNLQALKAEKEPAELQARTDEAAAKATAAQRANLATTGEEAARRGEVSYNDWFKSQKPEDQKAFPHPDTYDEEETPQLVRNAGLTAEQRTQASLREMRQASLERHQKAMEDLGMKRNETLAGKNGLMSASAMHQANSEVDKAILDERKLREARSNLGTAILGGNTYIKKNGEPVSMSKASNDDSKTQAELLADMEARYRNTGADYADALRSKYRAAARLGMEPQFPLEQALADIENGDRQFQGQLARKRSGVEKWWESPLASTAKPAVPAPRAAPVQAAPPAARPAATPAQAKTFAHTATGRNGQKIGSNDGRTWFDLKTGAPLQ